MNELQTFTFENDLKVRTVKIDGVTWWVAMDVCEILGTRTNDIPAILDDDERSKVDADTIGVENPTPNGVSVISEAGLYSLILKSRKPEAKAFKRWVTHVVIPEIRKTGSYSSAITIVNQSKSDLLLLAYNQALQLEEAQKREAAYNSERERLEAEARKWTDMVSAHGLYTLALAAKAIYNTVPDKMGRSRLSAWLRAKEYVCKKGECEPYQKFIEQDLFRIQLEPYLDSKGKDRIYARTYITQKGVDHIINKLKGIPENPLALVAPQPVAVIEAPKPKTMCIDGVEINIDDMLKNIL